MSGLRMFAQDLAGALRQGLARDAPDIEATRASILAKLQAIIEGKDLPTPARDSSDGMGYAVDIGAIRESLHRRLIPEAYNDETQEDSLEAS